MMRDRIHLDGHLALNHALSPRWQFEQLPALSRWATAYPQLDLWETDTRHLPAALRALRSWEYVFVVNDFYELC